MKKVLFFLFGALLIASCEDVPAPYEIHAEGGDTPSGSLYYTSKSLQTGWTLQGFDNFEQPWSQGASYTQATGYQKWSGQTSKSNRAAKGFLISPSFNTTCESGKVKFEFMTCLNYTSNDPDCEKHYAIYISKNYSGNFADSDWEEIPYIIPKDARDTENYATVTSGEIALPSEYVNCENVHIAFYFEAPADKSMTWELTDFVLQEGGLDRSGGVLYAMDKMGAEKNELLKNRYWTVDDMNFWFDQGGEEYREPIYYNGVRLYPGNQVTINAQETLAEVVFYCDESYLGQGAAMTASHGTIKVDGTANTITITDINSTDIRLTNEVSSAGIDESQQLRFTSVRIKFVNP